MSKNVTVITLLTGTQIITRVAIEEEQFYVVRNPLDMEVDNSDAYIQRIYLSRYMPYSEDHLVVVNKSAVESMTLCSERFADMYEAKLKQFEASKAAITDADKTEVIDGPSEQTEDSQEDAEFDEEFGLNDKDEDKPLKTYH